MIRLAVISDVHAFDSKKLDGASPPSHCDVSQSVRQQCPLLSLHDLISDGGSKSIAADIVLCPGDFADKACSHSLPKVWDHVNQLRVLLGARAMFSTAGNHDVDSRLTNTEYDPIGAMKALNPMFPVDDRSLRNEFWADHFFIKDIDGIRILVLNSSAYHTVKEERERGRISEQTIKAIERELASRDRCDINVLLCHHNPHRHCEFGLGDLDEIKGGQLLLDQLSSIRHGAWLVVHGHKHHPKISYAAGGTHSAIVFSAGSIGSPLYPELQGHASNQFHVIEIDPNEVKQFGLVGRIKSWDWHKGYGWQIPEAGKGLPGIAGFGCRCNGPLIASRIAAAVRSNGNLLYRDALYAAVEEVRYLIPQDLRDLEYWLDRESILIELDEFGQIGEAIA